jgi:uncharacterized protein YdhG (YjbR/CyaY superfamily)
MIRHQVKTQNGQQINQTQSSIKINNEKDLQITSLKRIIDELIKSNEEKVSTRNLKSFNY